MTTGNLEKIQKELKQFATPEAKAATMKFVPGAAKVYGVRMPVLNLLAKKYKEGGFALVKKLWLSGFFEERILAAKLIGSLCRKDPELSLKLVTSFTKDIDNWALCDTIGMQSLKPVSKIIQKEIVALSARLMKSDKFWERRLSLVLLEVFTKDKSLHPEINKRIKYLQDDREYYVRKAVGWIERNLKKKR